MRLILTFAAENFQTFLAASYTGNSKLLLLSKNHFVTRNLIVLWIFKLFLFDFAANFRHRLF